PVSPSGRARPFHIRVEQAELDDLRARLSRTRWTLGAEAGWARGTDRTYMRELIEYWRDRYRWRDHEARLAELPQFIASIGDTDLHFVPLRTGGMPLLLLHGWPDSFFRYPLVAPVLARAGFDIVAPSLPGFAFSRQPQARPLRQVAALLHELMTLLGQPRF